MIKSMTAFSEASNTYSTITADVTIRSYNSRYLDIAYFCPESCQVFEDAIKKIIAGILSRGRIEIKLFVRDEVKDPDQFEVDEVKAVSYYHALKKIKEDLNLASSISLSNILSARDVIVPFKKEHDSANLWKAIEPSVKKACAHLDSMRKKEGKNLYSDLTARINYIEENLKLIEKDAAKIPPIYKKRLMERISYLVSDAKDMDMVRISQEAAVLADKSDVSEEIVRLYSHIKQFRDILDSNDSEGRKLNFLIQEFNREFNTIGSKAGNASLSHRVVDLKSELEKIREQVQNIE
ncbi:MAG: YicC family protein [Deltaproteobacteria bacterium]|nr:YicC family protein [Deltaproteobacteria bacterium]